MTSGRALCDRASPKCAPSTQAPNQWFQTFPQAANRSLDLREKDNCYRALENADHVYNLAADVGGMGVIERDCVERGALNVPRCTHRSWQNGSRIFGRAPKASRSECALGVERPSALRSALTRKAIAAKLSGSGDIVIWGDGTQTRSFMYIDDCVKGTQRIMHLGITDPINLGER